MSTDIKTNQHGIERELGKIYDNADAALRRRNLHLRVRDTNSIEDKNTRVHEELRHSLVRYELESFINLTKHLLGQLKNKDELIYQFDYIDTGGIKKTNANMLEYKMLKLKDIIKIIHEDPSRYVPDDNILNRNIVYDKNTGILSQSGRDYPLKPKAKKLINYLWGKRSITYTNRSAPKKGQRIQIKTVAFNTEYDTNELVKIIDNFNSYTTSHGFSATIKRHQNTLRLETINEFPT